MQLVIAFVVASSVGLSAAIATKLEAKQLLPPRPLPLPLPFFYLLILFYIFNNYLLLLCCSSCLVAAATGPSSLAKTTD